MSNPATVMTRLVVVMSLLIAIFIVMPVTDAAACGPELASAHQGLALETPDDHGDQAPQSGDLNCSHGHCHHQGAARPPVADLDRQPSMADARHARPADARLTPFAPHGLMRPPRA